MPKTCPTCGKEVATTTDPSWVHKRTVIKVGTETALDFGTLPQKCRLCLTSRPPKPCLAEQTFSQALDS